MTGHWVGLSVALTFEELRRTLTSWFLSLDVGDFDRLVARPNEPWPPIVFAVRATPSEFPTMLDFIVFPGPQDEDVLQPVAIELARRFAEAYGCKTICEGTMFGDSDAPYWSIVWSEGVAYLADDSSTAFIDGEGGPVRIVRRLELPTFALDANAVLARPTPSATHH